MSQFTAINLSQVPAPRVIEELDFEQIFAAMLSDLVDRFPDFDTPLESDPAYKILQVCAYREILLRQRINDAAHAVMLPYAGKEDLDVLGALFGVLRLVISPADNSNIPPTPAVMERDEDFRYRIQLSLEGYSTAGPEGAYIYHALSASGQILDASAVSPEPGEVLVTVLGRNGDGAVGSEVLEAVNTSLSAESVRPLTDHVTVQSATIVPYDVRATLFFYAGPDREVVMANAKAAIKAYAQSQHRLGLDVTLSGVYASLHQSGVQRVELESPSANIVVDRQSATWCSEISLTDGGLDE